MSNKFLPALVCGFGAAIFTIIPGFKNVSCCLFIPLAGAFAVYLYQKTNREIEMKTGNAILVGLGTGLVAAVFTTLFDVIITYITGVNDFVNTLPEVESQLQDAPFQELVQHSINLSRTIAAEIDEKGYSLLYTFMMLMSNTFINAVFAPIGALIGLSFLKRRKSE
jgi:hypothetical protein